MELSVAHINSYFITNALHGELIEKLDEKGLKQNVFVPVSKATLINKNLPKNLIQGSVTYKHCFSPLEKFIWPLKMLKIWLEFKKFYLKKPTALIHAHTLFVNGLIAYWAFKKWKTPYLVTIRNSDLNVFLHYLPFLKGVGIKILKNASGIILLSPVYLNKHLAKYYPKDKYPEVYSKAVLIPNGISDFWLQNSQMKNMCQEVRTIVFSGQIKKNKNLSTLIKACTLLNENGLRLQLKIMGDGPLLADFRKEHYRFPIEFYGQISEKEKMMAVLRQSDILVVASFVETFGLVYPEAMSQGLPVIYTKNQGFDGFFPDGHVGFAVNPHDANEIASKIELIYADYDRFSVNASKASHDFSWNMAVDRLYDVYNNLYLQGLEEGIKNK